MRSSLLFLNLFRYFVSLMLHIIFMMIILWVHSPLWIFLLFYFKYCIGSVFLTHVAFFIWSVEKYSQATAGQFGGWEPSCPFMDYLQGNNTCWLKFSSFFTSAIPEVCGELYTKNVVWLIMLQKMCKYFLSLVIQNSIQGKILQTFCKFSEKV